MITNQQYCITITVPTMNNRMDSFGLDSNDPTQIHRPDNKKGHCPHCNRKTNKFASVLGRHFDHGKSCPNCRPKQPQHEVVVVQHSMPTPPSTIPSTLVVPSSSFNEAEWRENDQQDDNMTIISEITMDRALLEHKRPTRHSVESIYQTSSSSSNTPTPHLMGQYFTRSMDTLTEVSEDRYSSRVMHANDMASLRNERIRREQEENTSSRSINRMNSGGQTNVKSSPKRMSNDSSATIEYTLDKLNKFDKNIESYKKRGCSRSPSRSLPLPNNTTMFKGSPSQEERLSRSYNGEELFHEPVRQFGTNQQKQQQLNTPISSLPIKNLNINQTSGSRTLKQPPSIKDIPIILKCAEMYPTKNCIERAFQTVFLLSTEADPLGQLARREIVNLKCFELLHDSFLRHEKDADCVVALFNAVWALCFFHGSDEATNGIAVKKIQDLKIVECIICSLESHSDNVRIQEMGFDILNRFLDVLPPVQLEPATNMILSNLHHITLNSDVVTMGMDIVNCLCRQFDDSKLEVAKSLISNGHLLEKLTDTSTNLESKELVCQLLWCVTSIIESVSILSPNSESIINHINVVMEEVPPSEDTASFHESICGILANLAMLASNHVLMGKLGVVSIICEEIYAFGHSEYVLLAACTTLANLSVSSDTRTLLLTEDGVTAILFSMKNVPDSLDVQCEAMRALNKLAESPIACAAGVNTIISTIICYSDSKYIQKVGCSILSRISVNEKCRVALTASRGFFDTLIQIQKVNAADKLIQNDIISLMRNLSFEQSILPFIMNRGFVQSTLHAMEAHSDYAELQENGCDLLWKLSSFSSEAKIQICSDGGLQCIVKVILFSLKFSTRLFDRF